MAQNKQLRIRYLIRYKDPITGDKIRHNAIFSDTKVSPALEAATNIARSLSNHGWYEIAELERIEVPPNGTSNE